MLTIYRHKRLQGKNLYCHPSFRPALDVFVKLLEKYNLICIVTSSWRYDTDVSGAIVEPARKGNHLVGHAFDCNFIDAAGVFWNSKKLAKPTGPMKAFLKEVDDTPELRWGGAFNDPDSVHFDDDLNHRDPIAWLAQYSEYHEAA